MDEEYVAGLAERWAGSGAAGLTGRADGDPLPVPADLIEGVIACAAAIEVLTATHGTAVSVDGLALLGERAAITGSTRAGAASCGGGSRLLRTTDGWIALTLAREDDVEMLPAWLECGRLPPEPVDRWRAVEESVSRRSGLDLTFRATLLGLPCSIVGEGRRGVAITRTPVGAPTPVRPLSEIVVVDLSSLWAGPLCADLLGRAGCRVIKVESVGRPDGARRGPPAFFDLLHGGHESVAFDFRLPTDVEMLRRLVRSADVVIEASRPRALANLGIERRSVRPSSVWVSITGHGRSGGAAERVAFGDDAAAAGGLVVSDGDGLCFCGDAIADPLSGLFATASTLDALSRGGHWTVDVAMSRVAGSVAGGPLASWGSTAVAPPRARPVTVGAPSFGADTDAVIRAFGLAR